MDLSPPPRSLTRRFHLAACLGLVAFVSWGLLTSDPLSALSHTPLSFVRTLSDLLLHCGVYAGFSLVCCSFAVRGADCRPATWMIVLLIMHGIGTELMQTNIPRRTADPLDALANIAGIFAGAAITSWLFRRTSMMNWIAFRRRGKITA